MHFSTRISRHLMPRAHQHSGNQLSFFFSFFTLFLFSSSSSSSSTTYASVHRLRETTRWCPKASHDQHCHQHKQFMGSKCGQRRRKGRPRELAQFIQVESNRITTCCFASACCTIKTSFQRYFLAQETQSFYFTRSSSIQSSFMHERNLLSYDFHSSSFDFSSKFEIIYFLNYYY